MPITPVEETATKAKTKTPAAEPVEETVSKAVHDEAMTALQKELDAATKQAALDKEAYEKLEEELEEAKAPSTSGASKEEIRALEAIIKMQRQELKTARTQAQSLHGVIG